MANHGKKRSEDDREVARLTAILKQLPASLVGVLSPSQLSRAFHLNLRVHTIWNAKRHFVAAGDIVKLGDTETDTDVSPPLWIEQQLVLDNIGRILSRTYAYLGDKEEIGSEDALRMVYRELKQYDFSLITRNARNEKQTPRKKRG
ncbi:MAG TPA: hypothetical protein VNI02_14525 [Blastocatellia bacterium]|jgi:hypothetical protein|nr:hypothetical protein [Blastocatellia bacterium]